jgi:hypothetical protein
MDRRDAITATFGLVAVEVAAADKTNLPVQALASTATALERAAGVTIVRNAFAPGDVRRYGAVGDGATDDSSAWRAALATGHRVLGGGPEHVYCFDQQVPIVRSSVIDLQGATIKPRGGGRGFVRTPPSSTATSAVRDGAVQGARSLTLQSSSGFEVGQWLRLVLDDYPAHDRSSYPPAWTRVVAVRADAVELETPLQITYGSGDLRVAAYRPGLFCERFECRNGIFDGSECTYDTDTGQALRIGGTERVLVHGCEFRNFRHEGQLTNAVELFTIIDAVVDDCRFTGGVSQFNICDIQEVRFAHFVNNLLDGSHLGCNITRADYGLFANNSLHGQRAREVAERVVPQQSVRGLKAYGCAAIRILGNHATDYESPIKVEACFRYDVSHNTVFNAGSGPFGGQIALNIGSIAPGRNMHDGRIIANHVEGCGGIGIGVTTDPPGGLIVSGNIVRATQAAGIHIGVPNAIVSGNRVEDWGLRGAGDPAIRVSGGATVADNRFAHATLSSVPCIAATAAGDARLILRDNVSEGANPLTGHRG